MSEMTKVRVPPALWVACCGCGISEQDGESDNAACLIPPERAPYPLPPGDESRASLERRMCSEGCPQCGVKPEPVLFRPAPTETVQGAPGQRREE